MNPEAVGSNPAADAKRFPKADAPAIVVALALLPPDAAAGALEHLIAATATSAPEPTAHLLARAAAAPGPGFVVGLMTALGGLDPALAERAADTILARPAVFDADAELVSKSGTCPLSTNFPRWL